MAEQYFGTIEELKQHVETVGIQGEWSENPQNSTWKFKARTGEILNWWTTGKNTLQFQGKNQDDFKSMLIPLINDGNFTPAPVINEPTESKQIFIVHGHDATAKDQLELILRRLGLEPYILQNNDSGSKTIVEALENKIYQESAMGIILMTPDDYGYKKDEDEADRQPRARQNVILEMGMVMASLGRDKMLILKKGALEMPSDTDGILYHEFNDHVKEVVPKIAQRLQQVGIEIDPSKIAQASA